MTPLRLLPVSVKFQGRSDLYGGSIIIQGGFGFCPSTATSDRAHPMGEMASVFVARIHVLMLSRVVTKHVLCLTFGFVSMNQRMRVCFPLGKQCWS